KLGVPASGVDESYPYSTNPITEFAACRIRSEQDVLASHDESGLQTIVIRIPTTYGPRDRFHIPSHLRVSRRYGAWGIGTAKTICGSVYSENAAHALICAEDALRRGKGGGHAYFVSDHA